MNAAASRNRVPADAAEENRGDPAGRYTFNALIDAELAGAIGFTVAALRLGDHAHLDIRSGRVTAGPCDDRGRVSGGRAGQLVLRWEEWLELRAMLEPHPTVHIAEVENPTAGQLSTHIGHY